MANWFLTWGSIFVPSSLVFLVLGFGIYGDNKLLALYCFGVAIIFMVVGGYYMVRSYDRFEQQERQDNQKFVLLIQEIKGLRQDLRGDKNDHANTDDRK